MENLRIRLIGAPTIELNGKPVVPGRRKVTALVAYLAATESPQPRDGVCAVLWPTKSSQVARAELRGTIAGLRSLVGPDFVRATRSTVALDPEVSVDIREVRALLQSAFKHHHGEEELCPDCIRSMERAVALCTGDFLAGFSFSDSSAFDEWMVCEADRLRDSLDVALEALSRPVVADANSAPLRSTPLDYARMWLHLDSLNEAAHRRLMTLYALAGQRGTALSQFATCAKLLEEELGNSPSRETVALKGRIKTGSIESEPPVISDRAGEAAADVGTPARDVGTGSSNRRWAPWIAVGALAAAIALVVLFYGASNHSRTNSARMPIAVLPLVDNSSSAHNEWFAGGMTEAIITDLAKIAGLRVTSRSSVDVLAESRPSISQIRSQLGVDYVVEGSVSKAGDRVRINARLIDARSDQHIWADQYESNLANVIGLQRRIAEDIASHVSAHLSTREIGALTQNRTIDPDAYEAYLLGAFELTRLPFDREATRKCLTDLERSIEIDSTYAPAHAALANYYWRATQFHVYPSDEGMSFAEAEAEHAVALNPRLSEGHTVLGFVRFLHDYDWQGSEHELKHAIDLKPSSAEAHCWYGSLLCTEGRFEEAISELTKARDIDPLSLTNIVNVAMGLYYARDYDGAIDEAKIARGMQNDFYMSHMVLGYALAAKGSLDEAASELETAAALAGDGAMEPLAVLAYVYNRAGRQSDAERAISRLTASAAKGMSLSPLLRAYIPLGRGQYEEAMNLIEQAYAEHDLNLAWNFQDPFFDPLRYLPRFAKLRKQMNL